MTIVARTESNLYLTTYILKGKYTIYEFLMTALRGNLVATKKWFPEIDCKAIISISTLSLVLIYIIKLFAYIYICQR